MSAGKCDIIDFNGVPLNEDDVAHRITQLRELVLADDELKFNRTDDAYMLRFLYFTDFNVDVAFESIQHYHALTVKYPDWFLSSSPQLKIDQINQNTKVLFEECDRSGRPIYVVKLGRLDVNKTTPQLQSQLDELWMELVMDDRHTQAVGLNAILDVSGCSWQLFRWLTIANMKISSAKANLYPLKHVIIHVINTSIWVNAAVKLMWPFVAKRHKEVIKFHYDDWSSLHKYIDPDILPSEYGGTGLDIDHDRLNQMLFSRFDEIEKKLNLSKCKEV